MDKKVTGIVAYITWIGWLIAYLAGDKEGAKFHLNQALVIAISQLAVGILNIILRGLLFSFILNVLSIIIFVFAIIGLISAIKEEEKELPLIGSIKILK